MCSTFIDEDKEKKINSDKTPTMLASRMFDKILHDIQSSNLNFQVQISPFSALISIKKSLVKERNGTFRLPPLQQSNQDSELSALQSEIAKLERMLETVRHEYEHAVDELSAANGRIKFLEECLDNTTKDKMEEPDNDKVSQLATNLTLENETMKKTIEHQNANLKELENALEVKNKVIENLNRNLSETKIKTKDEIDAYKNITKLTLLRGERNLEKKDVKKLNLKRNLTTVLKKKMMN